MSTAVIDLTLLAVLIFGPGVGLGFVAWWGRKKSKVQRHD